jgi:hypothetical protein
MSKKPPGPPSSKITRRGPPPLPAPVPMSPETEEALDREISEKQEELNRLTLRLNLRRAVLLAEQAERGEGPLVEHFADLGQRYAHLVDKVND